VRYVAACLAIIAVPFVVSSYAVAQSAKPLRHLIYSFTWGTSTDLQMQNSGMTENGGTSGSGIGEFGGGTQDKGTITVDVLREQPDRGLVVRVSEQAQGARSAPPAMCVVFGNTNVICDSSGKVTAEELSLVRLLGTTFIDPSQIDAKQHWQVQQSTPEFTTVSDFTISANAGGVMRITESRTVTGSGSRPYTRNVNTTIGYDSNKLIPTAVTEDSVERSERANQYQVVKAQTTLQLQTDSLAAH
jgi:hypothetical protein